MDQGGDEWQWLNSRWARMRDTLRDVALRHCDAAIEEIGETGGILDATWQAFILAMVGDLQSSWRIDSGLQDAAINLLLGDTALLRRSLIDSRAFLRADETGRGRNLALKRGFARLRDERIGGGSEHSGKTWGRLDKLSREIARKHQLATGQEIARCTMTHFMEIVSYIREHHGNDPKYPKKLNTIKELFLNFCDECQAQPVEVDPSDIQSLPDADAKGRYVLECLDDLPEQEQDFVRVKWQMSEPVEISVASYCRRIGLAPPQFGKVLRFAIDKLKTCVMGKLMDAQNVLASPGSSLRNPF